MPACNVCKAKSETIDALKMVIQAQNQSLQLLAERAVTPQPVADPVLTAIHGLGDIEVVPPPDHMERKWVPEDEEFVLSELAAGEIDADEAEKRIAALQVQNPPILTTVR